MMLYIYKNTPYRCYLDTFADCADIHDVKLVCQIADSLQGEHPIDGPDYRRFAVVNAGNVCIHKAFTKNKR